jgi:hypothetical protein
MPQKTINRPPAPGLGMSLSAAELNALHENGVYADSRVYSVRPETGRMRLRGEETGGAGKLVGHYIGYSSIDGYPFQVVQPMTALTPNAQHRRVYGNVMVRFEVFRYSKDNVHTQISVHLVNVAKVNGKEQETHVRRILFEGRFGEVDEKNTTTFFSSAGDRIDIPDFLKQGFLRALAGSRCRNCGDTSHEPHFAKLSPLVMPQGLLEALKLAPKIAKPVAPPQNQIPEVPTPAKEPAKKAKRSKDEDAQETKV